MRTAVVIPSFKVKAHILNVVEGAMKHADKVYVVDDACPEQSGQYVQEMIQSDKVQVLFHQANAGVGAAVKTGYQQALADGCDVVIKMDGDGQMDPSFIPTFVEIIESRKADYVKGNRFYDPRTLRQMPTVRLLGNSVLSLINKSVNGYWNIIDPTNGYTAISATAIRQLDLERIDNRYFFESDMLFRLGLIRAVVKDISIPARYADEQSNLSIRKVLVEFPPKYVSRFFKRLVYQYYLRDFNIASIEIVIGLILFWFGVIMGAVTWYKSVATGIFASTGTVMLSVLPIILGFQLLLSAMNFDIQNVPKEPLSN